MGFSIIKENTEYTDQYPGLRLSSCESILVNWTGILNT